jgi:threonine dehydrogenase-like Zn-dependent dehydrogenase
MKAVVFHGVGDIRIEEVEEPKLQESTDAIVRLTASAICGTDLHMVRGTMNGMKKGTILGHEGVGIVEECGDEVRKLSRGDRVVICSTISCGTCPYCRAGHTSQCDAANPNGPRAGTAFFGGPQSSGPFHGLQAEKARIPYADSTCVKLPDDVSDEQAILLSDVFPTGYFGAALADIRPGATVAVFGCGPVGQFAIASAKLLGAGRVFAIDTVATRLQAAANQGAEAIDYEEEDPTEALRIFTAGIGVDCAIDAVGIDANCAHFGPAALGSRANRKLFKRDLKTVAPHQNPRGDNWHPGDGPSQVLSWAVEALAKGGTLAIIGVYPETAMTFPIGKAMNKNLSVRMGNCNHSQYVPFLVDLVHNQRVDPAAILSHVTPLPNALEAYRAFDRRAAGWTKVELTPSANPAPISASGACPRLFQSALDHALRPLVDLLGCPSFVPSKHGSARMHWHWPQRWPRVAPAKTRGPRPERTAP